ncbi:helix-turn-helix domain-containing protein [Psychrobacillus sp. Sa2BUA9]|uniref:Helix-turn-helix domain-containing protein n=1 Tax=Psychrobacillus faecigallinarum TaxID=2762235 RepID=A0ABR8RBV4_9BACI|nr:helix-turn-helix domain-containing protein [Psychrobacillus faecigallinarum]MBD7945274.1 helix-turn-helix domain-containing protein [Psychrobacillus faecigallinarum]
MSIFSLETEREMKDEIIEQIMKTVSFLVEEKSRKRYLKFSEACTYASVSPGTLQKWVEKYGMPISIIEGRKIVDTRDLDEFIAKHKI